MRILIVNPTLGQAFGQERVIRDSSALLRGAGHEVFLLGESATGDVPPVDGLALLPGLSRLNWLSPRRDVRIATDQALSYARRVRADVVHFFDQFDYRLMRAFTREFPSAMTSHTISTTCPSSTRQVEPSGGCRHASGWGCLVHHRSQNCLSGFRNDLHRANAVHNHLLRRRALHGFGKLGAISRYVAEALARDGFDPARITLLRNPVALPEKPRTSVEVPRPLLLSACRLTRHKGIRTAIEALRLISDQPWTYWICGDGDDRPALERMVRSLGFSERIFFRGSLDYGSLQSLLFGCEIFLQTNVGPEPFGLSVAEASAAGRAVVASAIPALDEIVEHERSGLLVAPGDPIALAGAISRLLESAPLRRAYGETGRELVGQRFSPERHLEATLGVYREVIGAARGSADEGQPGLLWGDLATARTRR